MVSNDNRPLPGTPGTDPAAALQLGGTATIPTDAGTFQATAFRDGLGREHMAYIAGAPLADSPLVRLHSECLTGDALGSIRCDCGSQLRLARQVIASHGGILLYLRGHEGRGIGLGEKMRAYQLQDGGLDTVDANEALGHAADARTYDVAANMLYALDVGSVRLLSNNPAKQQGLSKHGIRVVEQLPLLGEVTAQNARYLETKRERMDHSFDPVVEGTA